MSSVQDAAVVLSGISDRAREALDRLGVLDGVRLGVDMPPGPSSVKTAGTVLATANAGTLDEDKDLGPLPPGYSAPPWIDLALHVLKSKLHTRGGLIFRGEAGTGKTVGVNCLIRLLRKEGIKAELFVANAFKGFSIEDLRGNWTFRDGQSEFTYGPLALAVIYSFANPDCIVVAKVEEANMAHPAVFSWLNTLADGSGDRIMLPDGRPICTTPGMFKLVLCYNEDYVGTSEINQALYNRLTPIDTEYLPAPAEAEAIHASTGLNMDSCKRIVALAKTIRDRVEEHRFILSPRPLICWAELVAVGWDWMMAFDAEILSRVGAPGSIRGEHRETISQIAQAAGVQNWPKP